MKLIKVGETNALYRRVYFDIRASSDGITPANGEAGKQPMISVNGAAFTAIGISVLTLAGNGLYFADIAPIVLGTSGTVIHTIYAGANCVTTPGDKFMVVAYDPDEDIATIKTTVTAISTSVGSVLTAVAGVSTKCDAISQGVTAVNNNVNGVASKVDTVGLAVANVDTDVAVVVGKVDSISADNVALSTKMTAVQTSTDATSASVAGLSTKVWISVAQVL